MLGGTLWLLLLLLLPLRPQGTQDHRGATSSGQEDEEPAAWPGVQRLKEQLRTVGTLSRRYWGFFSCTVWPDHCHDQEAPAPPLGWSLPLWGRWSLDRLTEWFCRFQDCCTAGGDCRISNNFTDDHCSSGPGSPDLRPPSPDTRGAGSKWRVSFCDTNGFEVKQGLESDLRVRLHGQHLASELVLRAVRGYLEKPQGDKALALSFHGWSGTGKNFVARMLAENLYRDGLRSDCVKMFISTFHFPHPKYADVYKEELRWQMQETRRRCQQTMFIFDEAEKLHPGLLELLGPHLESRVPETQGVEPPRAVFLFLSNLGGSVINKEVLGLLKAGWSREEITMQHLETPLQAEVMASTDSSFGSSRLVKENLIDFFVPFLPLEYCHVRLCVRDAFLSQDLQYTEEALDEIAKMMTYVPEEERLFSSQGCKSIAQRINLSLP